MTADYLLTICVRSARDNSRQSGLRDVRRQTCDCVNADRAESLRVRVLEFSRSREQTWPDALASFHSWKAACVAQLALEPPTGSRGPPPYDALSRASSCNLPANEFRERVETPRASNSTKSRRESFRRSSRGFETLRTYTRNSIGSLTAANHRGGARENEFQIRQRCAPIVLLKRHRTRV